MIPNNLDVFRSANLLVKQHGEDAPIHSAMLTLKGTSKIALMSPNLGSGCQPVSGFWHSVAPARLI